MTRNAKKIPEDQPIRDEVMSTLSRSYMLEASAGTTYSTDAIETAWARLKDRDDTHYDALRAKFYKQ